MTNQQIYILDSNLNPMPVGAIGEIYIGGAGVARGYINNPDLTSEKFIANPFVPKSDKKQEILYKTGDLGRWHPDGTIEFIGRRDFQIKLYGHRIEITEIETRLNSYPEIKQSAIVLVQAEKNERLLIGYYTANKQLPEEDIKHYLSEYLPNFMQPNKIIYLPEFPLTTSSKIDRNKLSGYNVNFLIKNNYVEPRNKLEKIVCKVFTEILGLSVNHVGIHDDFFKLGGNSLLAVKAASKLKQVFNLNVEVADIFKYKTPIQLVINVNFFRKTELGPVSSNNSMVKTTLLSFAQERLWVITKYQNCGSTYNVPFIFRLKKGYSIDILINSLKAVINRHEVLKTIIKEDQFGNTFPKILSANIDIDIKSLATKTSLHNFLQQDIGYIFNLNRELPVKIACYIFKDEYYISLIVHHIAFDGWSGEILIHDLIKYYKYHNQNRSKNLVNLPEIPIKYQDFAIWQRNYLKTQAIKEQLIFWEKKLNNYEQLNLPIDKHRPTVFDYMGSVLEFELPVGLSHNLRICAKDLGVSLYSLMLSGFYLLLRIYSNQDDVVLGTIVSNRHYKNVENVVGFFVNALVLRQQINSTSKIIDFINIVFNEVIEAQQNQDIPFEKLVDKLEINKDLSRHPIFQVVFSVQNFGNAYKELFSEYKFKDMHKTAKFDLSLIFDDSNEKLKGKLEYATSLFELNTIKGYINTYKVILQQLIKIKDKKFRNRQIRDLYYLDKATYQKVIIDYNNTYREYETNKTIHQLFEEQVEKTPDNIAVVFEDKKLTYHELNCKSNQLAHYIKRQYNICPNDLIALLLNRNENMVIAILAVLKSGGAYVPIDPEYPDSRINYILEDIMPKIIIINISHHNRLSNITNNYYKQASVLPLDKIDFQPILTSEPINNLSSTSTGVDLAYVIYTSGTTGYPKGVKIKHYNLINTVHCLNNIYNLDVECRVSAFCSYVFDVSLIEIFTPLTIGASVYVISDQLKTDIFALSTYILANKINCVYLPPLLLTLLPKIDYPNLKKIIYAGEPCNKETGIYWSNYLQLFNYYGPTETTIFSIGKQVINGDVNLIGKPLNNYKIYILGKDLEPVPIGAFGELYIGGIGVAEEYLNRPELTAQKFILNPFQIIQEKSVIKYNKLYKTGDIVRYSSNNDLEYIGRTDSQVKIRGYRIELKEIENLLNRYKGIKQCIVTLTYSDNLSIKNENKNIVAYYIKDHKINLSSTVYVINNWKKIYNLTYSQTQQDNFKNNFIGWNSSYTGKPISLGQMQEWHNETINKINQLPTQRILEIGTGSGLLLYKLIKQCIFYYAFDVSEHAINYNQKNIDDLGYSNKFQAFAVSADKIGFNTFYKNYDTVILNSVIQYFPSLEYLENVLTQAIDNIKSPGQIFIGDVRDFRLFECFAYAVINFKKGTVNISDIEYFKLREKELLITPEYFLSLKNKINSISSIELLPKLGSALNEMNCYRYDVILHINKEITTPSWQIKYSQFKKIMNLEHFLKNTIKDQLFIKYPNYRIVKDYISCRHLYGYDCDISTGNLDKLLNIMQLSKIFEQFGYIIKLFLDIKHPLYLNIVAYKNLGVEPKHINIDYSIKRLNKINFANKPMQNIMLLNTQYIEELREYLKSQLPDYMIPQYLIPIDKIPLNASGKLDYDALPKPEFYLSNDYTPPKTRLEKALCKTFSQILNIGENRIGIKDNFFNIGGNSLLAIKLMYQINSQFKHKIPIVDIFTNNTVQSLASYLSSVRQNLNYINNLNNVYDKPNMFMIHPAFAGAEVYVELAREFSKMYSCYGLDNYNLHHDKKIQDIQKLAEQYLDRINYIRKQTNQEDEAYVLLGWSLGGQIALNIANILEQNGKKNIYLILIDSVYPDNKFSKHLSNVVLDQTQLNTFAQRFGFDMRYVNKVKNNFHYDIKLSFQGIKIKLEHSKVLLFKAMKKEAIVFLENYGPLKEYVIKLPYNNVDKAVNPLNIHLVQLQDSDHFNLLEQHKLIYQNTLPFIDNKQISQIDKKL